MSPARRPARLTDGRVDSPVLVPATAVYNYPATELDALEALWAGPRAALAAALRAEGAHLESAHWDWRAKKDQVASGAMVLIALEAEDSVQGLIAVARSHRASVLSPGESVAYVDYIEAAPWNVRAASHPPRFLGVGTALITEAVRLSTDWGLGGRLGLHSLPQAEPFYESRCQMRRVGTDPSYYDLAYFEYPEGEAHEWLASVGYTV